MTPQPDTGHDYGSDKIPGKTEKGQKLRVLFICTHNSARSQMAEGYLRARHADLFDAASAGTEVREVHPLAVKVMGEIGIDISGYRSKLIDEFSDTGIDLVVTVCDSASGACPFFPKAASVIHAGFPDPSSCNGTSNECLEIFRTVRDGIISWIDHAFIPEYGTTGNHREPGFSVRNEKEIPSDKKYSDYIKSI
jgi:arsenate reductase